VDQIPEFRFGESGRALGRFYVEEDIGENRGY